MKSYFRIALILTISAMLPAYGYSQKISLGLMNNLRGYSDAMGKKNKVSMQLLKSATEIIYGFNNGSVAPEYAYQGYIVVTPEDVSLKIYNMSSLCYFVTVPITSRQYSVFLNDLFSAGIKTNPDDPLWISGGGRYDITIKKGDKKIFEGTEDEDIVTSKGRLCDPFLKLLTPDMMEVYKDPGISFRSETEIYWDEIEF